jgi:hypothetical protein
MAGSVHYVVCALVTAAFLAGGWFAAKKTPVKVAPWLLGPCVLGALFRAVLMLRPDWETAIFPWPFYAFYQQQWVYPMGVFILAYAAAWLPVLWNRVVVVSFAGLLLCWSLVAGLWMLREPCPGEKTIPPRGQMTVQSTQYTCAPAVCATLLRCWGIEKSEHEMAQLCLCRPGRGTTLFDKYRGLTLAAEGSGLRARVISVPVKDLGRLVRPFAIGAHGHALLVFEVRGDRLLIGDPFNERPAEKKLRNYLNRGQQDFYVFLLCRSHPFDGFNAPHLGEWIAAEGTSDALREINRN